MATIRKRNGKYQVQVRRADQPPISKTFYKKRDAELWARQMESLADVQDLPSRNSPILNQQLSELVNRYVREVIPYKRCAEYETIILNAFLRDPICQLSLKELSEKHFAEYRDRKLADITAASLRRQLNPIHNMIEVARNEWKVPLMSNPLNGLRMPMSDLRRERRLRAGEFNRLLADAKKRKNKHFAPIIQFALQTAMRRSEILRLEWSDVDQDGKFAYIRETKNGSPRNVPLSNEAQLIIENQREISNSQLIFPMSANALRISWGKCCKRVGVDDLHFHDLRHEAISRFFEKGLTVPEVASISGHKDVRSLMRYAHADILKLQEKISQ